MEPPPSSPLAPRNPATFEPPQDCSSWIPQGQNLVHSVTLPALLSQYTSTVRLKVLARELPHHVYGQIQSRSGLTTRNRLQCRLAQLIRTTGAMS